MQAFSKILGINKIKSLKKYKNNQTFRNAFINFEQEYNRLNNKVEIIRASGNLLGKEVDNVGHVIDVAQPRDQHPLVILVNKQHLAQSTQISEPLGICWNPARDRYEGAVITFTNQKGQKIALMNLHLPYPDDEYRVCQEHYNRLAQYYVDQGYLVIHGGDHNHSYAFTQGNRNPNGIYPQPLGATNIGRTRDKLTAVDPNLQKHKGHSEKTYDQIGVVAPGGVSVTAKIVPELRPTFEIGEDGQAKKKRQVSSSSADSISLGKAKEKETEHTDLIPAFTGVLTPLLTQTTPMPSPIPTPTPTPVATTSPAATLSPVVTPNSTPTLNSVPPVYFTSSEVTVDALSDAFETLAGEPEAEFTYIKHKDGEQGGVLKSKAKEKETISTANKGEPVYSAKLYEDEAGSAEVAIYGSEAIGRGLDVVLDGFNFVYRAVSLSSPGEIIAESSLPVVSVGGTETDTLQEAYELIKTIVEKGKAIPILESETVLYSLRIVYDHAAAQGDSARMCFFETYADLILSNPDLVQELRENLDREERLGKKISNGHDNRLEVCLKDKLVKARTCALFGVWGQKKIKEWTAPKHSANPTNFLSSISQTQASQNQVLNTKNDPTVPNTGFT